MTDDLVKRLRGMQDWSFAPCREAADRIEKLEAALHQWDDLIVQQFTGSEAAMSDMNEAAQITAALLHGDAPWPETRIEKLEAALRAMLIKCTWENTGRWCGSIDCHCRIARKALEGKDGPQEPI